MKRKTNEQSSMGNLKNTRTSLESVQAYLSNALPKFRYQSIDKLLIRCITRLQRTDSGPLQPLLGDASRHDSMHAHSVVSAKHCRLHAYCWFGLPANAERPFTASAVAATQRESIIIGISGITARN